MGRAELTDRGVQMGGGVAGESQERGSLLSRRRESQSSG